jgi:hypothetical protein
MSAGSRVEIFLSNLWLTSDYDPWVRELHQTIAA